MKKFAIIIGIVISILVLILLRNNLFYTIENKVLDFRFLLRGPTQPGDEVVIIAIDEKTLDELGRWPFPRRYFAGVVKNLNKWGVSVIAFDMVFDEPDKYSGMETVDYIQEHIKDILTYDSKLTLFFAETRATLDSDYHFAMELDNTPKVVLAYFFHMNEKNIAHLTDEERENYYYYLDKKSSFGYVYKSSVYSNTDVIPEGVLPEPNIDIISKFSDGFGFFNVFPDLDGTNRWTQLVMRYKDRDVFFPSLAFEVARAYLGAPKPGISVGEEGAYKIELGDIEIPVDPQGRMLINYRGGLYTYPYYSFTDVYHGKFSADEFENKIAIIGTVAMGTYDLRVSPFTSEIPGMEINATIIDNILHQDFLYVPRWEPFLVILVILIFGILLGFVLPRVNAWQGAIVSIILVAGWLGYTEYMFRHNLAWIEIMPPLLTVAMAYTTLTLIRYIIVERAGRQIKSAFEFYVPEAVVDEIIKDPSKLTLGGDRKEVSILFSDIAGFTTFSENLSPEELVHILNEYLTAMTDVVFTHRGLLDKYIGDAIMAVYGAPLEQPDHHLKACLTALDMMSELGHLQEKWKREGRPKLEIRIGVNSGFAAVGNMGSEKRFDYTVMGDNVNLASRLEGINKIYGTNIIISEFTYEHVNELILCRELDLVRVKGKTKPVKIYEVLGKQNGDQELQKLVHLFEKAMAAARERDWDVALAIFKEVQVQFPDDKPTALYIDRITEAKHNPPEADWDGVFDIKTK
ncbi:MAG: CHASE2 domain-containing protein [Deltaproteobacteria bacterium]|nr:CHASE2 domain-containing protein [Candidatus Zymogenaceae bacterium]